MIITRSVLVRMRNVSDKFIEKIETNVHVYNVFFFENPDVCEIRYKNTVEPNRPKMTIRRMDIT